MAGNPFGKGLLGQVRYGDELAGGVLPRSAALGLSYSIATSKYSVAMGLTYTVQVANVGILQLYYQITPATAFALNGDASIVAPDQVTYTPRQVYAHDLLASPLFGGFAGVTWTYSTILPQEAQHLLSFYDPTNPVVLLTYPSEDGIWIQRQATMIPPNYGSRETVTVQGLVLSFLILPG